MEQAIPPLSRNEVIALINTAAQLSKSIASLRSWRSMIYRDCIVSSLRTVVLTAGVPILSALTLILFMRKRLSTRKKKIM